MGKHIMSPTQYANFKMIPNNDMSSAIPEKVVKLARKIESGDMVDFSLLKEAVAGTKISPNDFEKNASFSHPPDQSYGRILLHESRRLKIFLMCWAPGDFTAIHDHGQTEWGCVVALGDFTHRVYDFVEGQLRLKSDDPFGEGEVACLTGDLIHMMGNAGNRNIMSLHIYGSDSDNKSLAKRSRVYFPEKKKVITTNGPAFLSCPEDSILEQEYFDSVDKNALLDYLNLIKLRSEKTRQRGVKGPARQIPPQQGIKFYNNPAEGGSKSDNTPAQGGRKSYNIHAQAGSKPYNVSEDIDGKLKNPALFNQN